MEATLIINSYRIRAVLSSLPCLKVIANKQEVSEKSRQPISCRSQQVVHLRFGAVNPTKQAEKSIFCSLLTFARAKPNKDPDDGKKDNDNVPEGYLDHTIQLAVDFRGISSSESPHHLHVFG